MYSKNPSGEINNINMSNATYKMCDWPMEEAGYIIVDAHLTKIIEVESLTHGFGVFSLTL